MQLNGQVAIIFGGSSGIGEATAELFGREGASVAVVASNDPRKADAVTARIASSGGRARSYVCDVRDAASIAATVEAVSRDLGPIDILVNSAGVYYPTLIGQTEEADFDRLVDINLKGTFFAIDAVARSMKARGRGRIVNVASVAGVRASPRFPVYCATKAAVIMLTKALAGDLAPHGVSINAIAPGNTATPLNVADRSDPEVFAAKSAATPSRRVYSPPEEMASAILFLVSGEVNAMHGATMLLDEGVSSCV